MKLINTPYLPETDVCIGVAGTSILKYTDELKRLGIDTLVTDSEPNLPKPVINHADLCVNYLGSGNVVLSKTQTKLKAALEKLGCKCYIINESLKNAYPEDCLLNCIANSTDLICNYDITSAKIKGLANGKTVIDVNQGYTKCSICAVSDKAFITDDKSIYKALKNAEYDVLEVEKGSVALDGYDYGFIGALAVKFQRMFLLFSEMQKHMKAMMI